MPSTPTPRLRVMQQARGENINAWGDPNLNNALQRLEEGQAKVLTLAITGDKVLSVQNYLEDEARSAVLILTGAPSAAFKITIPSVEKPYLVDNRTGQICTIGSAAGAAATVRAGIQSAVFCNGADTTVIDLALNQVRKATAPVDLNGQRLINAGASTDPTDVPTRQQVIDLTKPQADAAAASAASAATSASAASTARDESIAARNAAVASASTAASEADRAQSYANGLNLPPLIASDAGKALIVNASGSGYSTRILSATIVRSARTSNVALIQADIGTLVEITSGSFTQTFAPASSLSSGWWAYLSNSGTGDITLDPSGSETIDGLTSFIMYPGEVRLIQCDGVTLRSVVLSPGSKTFTTSGNLTWPPGVNGAGLEAKGGTGGGGGGGGGGGDNRGSGGGGGASPQTVQSMIGPQPAGSLITATCGAAGARGLAGQPGSNGGVGGTGGESSFGSIVRARGAVGGNGGTHPGASLAGAAGGSANNVSPNQGYASQVSTNGPNGRSSGEGGLGGASVEGGGKGGDGGAVNSSGQAGSLGTPGYVTVRFF